VQWPEPELQFSDFARWQREWAAGEEASRQVAYWKRRLRGVAPVFPPECTDGAAPRDADLAEEPIAFPNELAARLAVLGQRCGATLFMTLLTAFKALLLAKSGRDDICVATPMADGQSCSPTDRACHRPGRQYRTDLHQARS
jgi:hypothetical protein